MESGNSGGMDTVENEKIPVNPCGTHTHNFLIFKTMEIQTCPLRHIINLIPTPIFCQYS